MVHNRYNLNQVVTLGNRWWGWMFIIFLGLMMTSCTQRDDDGSSPAAQLQFSTVSFDGAARSLVDDVLLLDGQQLGAFLVDGGGADYDGGGYANLQVSADAVDASIALTPAKDVSLTATSGTLYAYYPHSDAVSDIASVPVTSGFTDYLWATPVTGLDSQHTSAAISLHHALAAIRVGVITSSCRFGIALRDAYSSQCVWGKAETNVSGITTTTSESTAKGDYSGSSNTTKIINVLGTGLGTSGAPAANYCKNYTFPSGKSDYLGSAGQWSVALNNKSSVESAISKCGGASLSAYYWTSTQANATYSWAIRWDYEFFNYKESPKSTTRYVRAFCSL